MKLSKIQTLIGSALLSALAYASTELNVSHNVHVLLVSAAIFGAGLGFKVSDNSTPQGNMLPIRNSDVS